MPELMKLEIFLRGSAIATLLVCAALFALRMQSWRKDGAVAALCIGLCAYLVVSSPSLGVQSGVTANILITLAALVPVLIYWCALELFQDTPQFARWQILLCGLIIATAWLSFTPLSLGAVRGVCVIILFSHLAGVILIGGRDDLIEERRRFRRWFLLAIAAFALLITGLEISGADGALPQVFYVLHALIFWGLAAVFLLWAVRVDPSVWLTERSRSIGSHTMSPAQVALIARVDTAMNEGLWQREGLTLGEMAQELGTQEHRLRVAINKGLGFRNFSSFVNGWRIARAKELLRDPNEADRTILSIAFDVGFASLGPFNRAFRETTGQTPTEFRKLSVYLNK